MTKFDVVLSTEDGSSGGGIEVEADTVEDAVALARTREPRFTKLLSVSIVDRTPIKLPDSLT